MTEPVTLPICADCETRYTDEGELVMDTYACPNDEGYCLNCCACEEHDTDNGDDPFYYPAKEGN